MVIHWTGKQWAVTSYGIETRDGKYPIAGGRVWEETQGHGWIEHMSEKGWVDMDGLGKGLAHDTDVFMGFVYRGLRRLRARSFSALGDSAASCGP